MMKINNITQIKRMRVLAQRVLAVAVINLKDNNELFDWAVYIDSVPGHNHELEKELVARLGCKQSKELASHLFPELEKEKYRS